MDNNPNKSDSRPPSGHKPNNFTTQFGLAMELPFVLVGATAVGGLLGYFLDHWLHTKVIFTLVFGGLGFFAGVRDVLRRLPANGDGKD
ncbi:MAG: AtpZ/AtpI family protein [Candidatus Acidiferrum sp.]